MKTISLTIVLLFSILCFSQNPIRLNIAENYNSKKELNISEVGTEIKYVQLETTENCYFSQINKIIIDDYIYVSAREGLFVFAENGKFIRSIGKKGRGPGEYNSIVDFDINNETVAILEITQHKILLYKNDGTYLKSIVYQNINNKLFITGNSCYVFNSDPPDFWGHSDSGILLDIYDNNEGYKTVRNKNSDLPSCCRNSYKFRDVVFFRQSLNDTIFSLVNDEVSAKYIIDLGKYKPKNAFGNVNDVSKVINCSKISETDRFLFLRLSDWNKMSSFCIYNKVENNLKVINAEGFQNNLDKGTSIFPEQITNNMFVRTLWYHQISDLVDKNKAGKNLTEIFKRMDLNSNPVLMLVKLKE